MKSVQIIVGAIAVIAVTIINNAEGAPKPQEFTAVDGFAFDGPIDSSKPSSGIKTLPTDVPSVSLPAATSSSTRPTGTQAAVTQSPEVTQCIQNCRNRITAEYNPVCGTDEVVYSNPGLLNCAKTCGRDVDEGRPGPCKSAIRG